MKTLSIGQVAKHAKVNIQTIRYYEKRGLIPAPSRRDSGYRQYSLEMVDRIDFIKSAQELGFSLKEIQELLSLRYDSKTSRTTIKRRVEVKVADIEEKVEALQGMKKALLRLVAACNQRGGSGECPILEGLDKIKVRRKNGNKKKKG